MKFVGPTGTFAVAPAACQGCPMGFYGKAEMTGIDDCTPCPRGTYNDNIRDVIECAVCPIPGIGSPEGSSNCFYQEDYIPFPSPLPAFSASNTDYARQNTVDQDIYGCPGIRLKMSSCPADGGSASYGYNNIRLYNSAGSQVAAGGWPIGSYCGYGAYFSITFTEPCQTYTLKQGCYDYYSCSGTVAIVIEGECVVSCTKVTFLYTNGYHTRHMALERLFLCFVCVYIYIQM